MQLTVLNSGSKGNCYLLTTDSGETLIIECGVKFSTVKQALNFELDKVAGCIYTHEHKDHCKGLRDTLVVGIDCYTSKGTIEACGIKHHRLHSIETKKTYNIGSFKVIAFDTIHDCNQPYGFLINHPECGNTLFITDSSYVAYKFPNLNNIIIEANYSLKKLQDKIYSGSTMEFLGVRIINNHMSLETCIEVLQNNDLKSVNNIMLIHLSDSNSDEKMFQKTVSDLTGKKITVATKGLTIPFSTTPF